jgi:hypothetical protein
MDEENTRLEAPIRKNRDCKSLRGIISKQLSNAG